MSSAKVFKRFRPLEKEKLAAFPKVVNFYLKQLLRWRLLANHVIIRWTCSYQVQTLFVI